ncbi:hypothetical protein CL1_0253 [Thermococcus cleftensis]|uniref:DUF996 domain-containing protein n=1 Tax=Thermococcus cleftensis (strain DSM 27260 / KACC 17922 / CL1) TaxID=163003 RepID=I3ZRY1_THECF|nr:MULTISPECIES: DUF996 domain-containing protein [Thermococcus]AFL94465.1 hypothetical protein CL1_0253 [Thermococcus cleftensis]NJE03180.1 DUF996 domain-containing protein [Thermococcus sp. MV11]
MTDLKNAKLLGGIGAILTVVGIGFIGFILKLLAVKNIAEATGREEIFSKYLWAAILAIIASLVWFGTIFGSIMGMNSSPEMGLGMMGIGGLVAALLMIAGMWFLKQSYDMISEETGVKTFHTVGLLYIVGAVLSIIVIGLLLIVVAAILEIIAFFSLPDSVEQESGPLEVPEEVY